VSDYLSIDFESRSEIDLFKCGIYQYVQSPTTEVLMMGWAFNDEPAVVWTPSEVFPQHVIDHVKAGGEIRAWNAQFERLMWWYVLGPDHDLPEPKIEQFRCTAARARAHGLPSALKDAAKALALPMQKQESGLKLIKLYCVPGHKKVFTPEDWATFVEYCRMDVDVERQVASVLRELSDDEWQDYWINEHINDRGVPIHLAFAEAAQKYGETLKAEADKKINELTGGAVKNARARSTRNAWLKDRLTEDQLGILDENGVLKFGQPRREELLASEDLHTEVRRFTELVEEAGGATIGKYAAFASRSVDGRLNGALLFSGGGQTGRFCIAEDEPIFVLRCGTILKLPIQNLRLTDLVWDGEFFVEHEGVVFSGYKEVMEYDNVKATPDHHVFTKTHGKVTLAEASERGYEIEVSGLPDANKVQLGGPVVPDACHEAVTRTADLPMWDYERA
jgi:DNA polymerase